MLRGLARRGHDVRALAFGLKAEGPAWVDGVPIERVRPQARIGNTPVHSSFSRLVARRLGQHQADVLLAHGPVPFPAEAAARAARRLGTPYVITYHAGRLRGSSRLLDLLASIDRATSERRMLDHARRLVAVSPYVADHALATHRSKTTVIPPGVDARRFSPGGVPPPHSILFLAPLSRSYAWKGADVLLAAFRLVQARWPDARLTVAGDGDRHAELERMAQGVPGIRFRGRLSETELVEAYRRHAVTVLPSTTDAESFGMVLAEANSCARPVVGTRIGGVPDFVREGENGLLARPGDPQDLADALARVFEEPALAKKMGERGRDIVLKHHHWAVLCARMERVLEQALQGASAAEPPLDASLLPTVATSL